MRKISPENIRDDFLAKLADLAQFHNVGLAGFHHEADQSTLTEHSLLSAAVIWERFVNDIFVAYLNRDSTRFKQHLQDSLQNHLKSAATPGRVFCKFGSLKFPEHLKKSDVLDLVDEAGSNITFPNFNELEKKAKKWLYTRDAEKFCSLTCQQKAVVNSVIALRNHIAHRSRRSLENMNIVLTRRDLNNTGIKRNKNRVRNVGAWLKSTPARHNQTRFVIIINFLCDIGRSF